MDEKERKRVMRDGSCGNEWRNMRGLKCEICYLSRIEGRKQGREGKGDGRGGSAADSEELENSDYGDKMWLSNRRRLEIKLKHESVFDRKRKQNNSEQNNERIILLRSHPRIVNRHFICVTTPLCMYQTDEGLIEQPRRTREIDETTGLLG
jgi:hypothetical protein